MVLLKPLDPVLVHEVSHFAKPDFQVFALLEENGAKNTETFIEWVNE